jgi:hypothetical protein
MRRRPDFPLNLSGGRHPGDHAYGLQTRVSIALDVSSTLSGERAIHRSGGWS